MKKNSLINLSVLAFFIFPVFTTPAHAQYIISTVAGNGSMRYPGDGVSATAVGLANPSVVAVDGRGNLFIGDCLNFAIRKVSPSGIITTVAGGSPGCSGDGGPATAAGLNQPQSIAIDGIGDLFIADICYRVRKVDTSGIISTVAGNGGPYSGDGGPATAAGLWAPSGVAVDGQGNIFIADAGDYHIRKVNTSGIISSVAGNGTAGYSGDGGPATAASLNLPIGITVDGIGNMFIVDQGNSCIRKVDTSGIITTIAGIGGLGTGGYSGDGGPATAAKLSFPCQTAIDGSGNLLIADQGSNRIRMVNTAGIITTVAGDGSGVFSGDGGPATAAGINFPCSVAADATGELFIADQYNNRIRKASPIDITTSIATIAPITGNSIHAYPNPTTGMLNIQWQETTTENGSVIISDITGREVYKTTLNMAQGSGESQLDLSTLTNGLYIIRVKSGNINYNDKVEVLR